ncbi:MULTISPECIES: VanZ family protein [Peptoniphilus]|uniref:Predicted integral membrane protein n=1 Tax=Peptoniphilus lacrimalis TaxID=33031 RepID=A0A379C6V1_9FIRM|nr:MULTISPECIES: VanZ family protein [Peptoniphilus]EFK38722.1 VanZ-like protein [Peptoniphilus sp. oral taxon 836 str. F0141]SUB57881.1 Predicted integral membrane protein [Peptoniphilus lacrimalis]
MKLFLFFFTRSLVAFLLTFIGFSQIRLHFFRDFRKKSNGQREFFMCLLASYLVVLAIILFTPNSFISSHGIDLTNDHFNFVGNFKDRISAGNWGVNLIPFRTIKSYIKYSGFLHSLINILGNVLIFLPLGYIIPIIYNRYKNFTKFIYLTISISIFIEFIQFFIGRSVDIDDLILNTLGGILGYLYYKKHSKKLDKIGR